MNLPVLTYRRFCTRAYSSSLLLMEKDPQDNSAYHQRDEERIPVLWATLAATGSRRPTADDCDTKLVVREQSFEITIALT
ncbi:MAG: hypothetical protein QOK23_2405 [Gammaproteobacteria bacterium]|nr:hypothetical protein [Gammaproteobacteria bacterium]